MYCWADLMVVFGVYSRMYFVESLIICRLNEANIVLKSFELQPKYVRDWARFRKEHATSLPVNE